MVPAPVRWELDIGRSLHGLGLAHERTDPIRSAPRGTMGAPLGRNLLEPVQALAKWAEKNREQIQAARDRFDTADKEKAKVAERRR